MSASSTSVQSGGSAAAFRPVRANQKMEKNILNKTSVKRRPGLGDWAAEPDRGIGVSSCNGTGAGSLDCLPLLSMDKCREQLSIGGHCPPRTRRAALAAVAVEHGQHAREIPPGFTAVLRLQLHNNRRDALAGGPGAGITRDLVGGEWPHRIAGGLPVCRGEQT